jgi:hypothetical protein
MIDGFVLSWHITLFDNVFVQVPHHIDAAPAPRKFFDAPTAPAPTLLYIKPTFENKQMFPKN